MITGLYETHVEVSNLEKAVAFYRDVLGLTLASIEEKRRIAFFWIGEPKDYMLGLWEKPGPINKRHFAFRCGTTDILKNSVSWLKARELKPYNFLKDQNEMPMVFAWMPALAIYFDDPDGNVLEFISILPGSPKPELGVITHDEWVERQSK